MVGFLIPIPAKVVDGVYNSGANLVKSYKKEPAATDLDATSHADEKPGSGYVPPPPARRNSSWGTGGGSSVPPPPGRGASRTGHAAPAPARTAVPPARAAAGAAAGDANVNVETFGPQLLAHVLDSISLLESLGQISSEAAQSASAALNGNATPAPAYSVPTPPVSRAPPVPPAPRAPAEARATALWDYGQGGDSDDLSFEEGDTVIIDEEVNDEWYRGRTIPKGRTAPLPKSGLFPSTYVQRQ